MTKSDKDICKIDNLKDKILNNNTLCTIHNNKNCCENVCYFLISCELNTTNKKTNWKKIVYPKGLFVEKDSNKLKDKRRQNFRITCSNIK